MKRHYIIFLMLLFPLATMFKSGSVNAQTDEEYNAAMAAIVDGCSYYIQTEMDGTTYYVTNEGYFTSLKEEAGLFIVKKTTGGAFKNIGIRLDGGTGKFFSNANKVDNKADLNSGYFLLNAKYDRDTYERQVFFLNSEGKYAIRACNTAHAESGWGDCGRVFWTCQIAEGDDFFTPCYSYEPSYIWTLETPADVYQISAILNSIIISYEVQLWDDEEGTSMNIGTNFGQRAAVETWKEFWQLLQNVVTVWYKVSDPQYDITQDPDAPTLDWANQTQAAADSMYQEILDSEIPYKVPADGYYRIHTAELYKSTSSALGVVDKALAAAYEKSHANRAVYGTLRRDMANFVWKLTQHGDSILIQNVGMGTYLSPASIAENTLVMTEDASQAAHITLDYAGSQLVQLIGEDETFDEDWRDVFAIRLSRSARGSSSYVHQKGHGTCVEDKSSPFGYYQTDSGQDQEMSLWIRTYPDESARTIDKWTSEYYLEPVSQEEVAQLVEAFGPIVNHDILVEKNNELRAQVAETLVKAKDVIRTKLITSATQMTSPYSQNDIGGSKDGGNLSDGVLLDGDASTYWHSAFRNTPQEPHYIQLSDMQGMVGDCEFYFRQRNSTTGNHPAEFTIWGSNDAEAPAEEWTQIAVLPISKVGPADENTVSFTCPQAYQYIRAAATNCDSQYKYFWHASEMQIYSLAPNPNSQFIAMGEIATNLEKIYLENCAVEDADITLDMYEALAAAYKKFLGGMVDPTELREALAKYADVTKGVIQGTNPGQWANTEVATQFDKLYAEIQAYDKSGMYSEAKSHKYILMLQAMEKSVKEQVNGVKTDTWYRIMFPTEQMYTDYGFDPSIAGGKASDLVEEQSFMWGNYAAVGKKITQEIPSPTDENPEATVRISHIEPCEQADVRENTHLYFMAEDEITDKAVSMFRFVECPQEKADYTIPMQEVRDNILLALDMSTTFTKGDSLIIDPSQLSSNASDQTEGQHIEYLIDGDPTTYWHSDYHKKALQPPYLQVALKEPVSGDIMLQVTRRNAVNGHIIRMYVQGSTDAENWTNIGYVYTPFASQIETVTSMPLSLNGTYSYLRFFITNRYGTDTGGNVEFDPFAEVTSAADYNKTYTYFHAAEFQLYTVQADTELSDNGKAMMQAYDVANKVVLKDATAEDFAAVKQAYNAYQSEFNTYVGKAVLPNGAEKAPSSYAIQNKGTGLFIHSKGGNTNDLYLQLIPTLYTYAAPGYQRSLLHGTNIDGADAVYMHAGNSDHRLCSWNDSYVNHNSALVLCEVEPVEPAAYTFYKDIQLGEIYNFCSAVSVTNQGDGTAYMGLGQYTDKDGTVYLALKEIETIQAGQPAFYILGDTTQYEADEEPESMLFTMAAEPDFKLVGDTINGFIACMVNHPIGVNDIYFEKNYPAATGKTGVSLVAPAVLVDQALCPEVDPSVKYDFSICLEAADVVDGLRDVSSVVKKIAKPGDVYSIDGKFIRSNATLNSLKSLGKGTYILNGVKVVVK
ncbi:MAG: discoidin domain-containing protein [Bacteroidaceae bacterium]|nr:discoidin domain-containing protein [Bacteroidaceae bacterium]